MDVMTSSSSAAWMWSAELTVLCKMNVLHDDDGYHEGC